MGRNETERMSHSERLSLIFFAIVAVLAVVAPRLLTLVFMAVAVCGTFSVKDDLSNPKMPLSVKGILLAEWIASWLLTFGFGLDIFNMKVVGLLFGILANVGELWIESDNTRRIGPAAWVLLYIGMMVLLILQH